MARQKYQKACEYWLEEFYTYWDGTNFFEAIVAICDRLEANHVGEEFINVICDYVEENT